MDRKKRTQRLALMAFFVAIEVIMVVTSIGYIPIGPLSITTMHVPVILAGVLMGKKEGAILGFVFGMTSLLRATFVPGITSFVFSPFITVGGVHGNGFSVLIALGPRILLGYLAGVLSRLLVSKMKSTALACGITAGICTLVHTFLVLGMIDLFFGVSYAQAIGVARETLEKVLMGVVLSNGLLEAAFAMIAIPALTRALRPICERMGFYKEKDNAISAGDGRGEYAH